MQVTQPKELHQKILLTDAQKRMKLLVMMLRMPPQERPMKIFTENTIRVISCFLSYINTIEDTSDPEFAIAQFPYLGPYKLLMKKPSGKTWTQDAISKEFDDLVDIWEKMGNSLEMKRKFAKLAIRLCSTLATCLLDTTNLANWSVIQSICHSHKCGKCGTSVDLKQLLLKAESK